MLIAVELAIICRLNAEGDVFMFTFTVAVPANLQRTSIELGFAFLERNCE